MAEEQQASSPYVLLDLLRQGKRDESLLVLSHDSCTEDDAQVNANRDGSTPLLVAATRGWGDAMLALLTKGASPNTVSRLGETPLMRAIKSGKIDPLLIHLLLDRYTLDINLQCTDEAFFARWTALHFACEAEMNPRHPETIALLVLRGADATLKDSHGQTAMDVLCNSHAEGGEEDVWRLALTNPAEALQRSDTGRQLSALLLPPLESMSASSASLLPAASTSTTTKTTSSLLSNGSFLGRLMGLTARPHRTNGGEDEDEEDEDEEEYDEEAEEVSEGDLAAVVDGRPSTASTTRRQQQRRHLPAAAPSSSTRNSSSRFSSLFSSTSPPPTTATATTADDNAAAAQRKSKTGSFILKMMSPSNSGAHSSVGKKASSFFPHHSIDEMKPLELPPPSTTTAAELDDRIGRSSSSSVAAPVAVTAVVEQDTEKIS